MGATEILALSLGLSVLLAGLAFVGVRVFDARCPDPGLRERAWTLAFHAPAASLALIAMALLAPPPRARPASAGIEVGAVSVTDLTGAPGVFPDMPGQTLALTVLACAGLLAAVRAVGLARRLIRLRRQLGQSHPASPATLDAVRTVARDLDVPMPDVRAEDTATQAMVVGLFRPVLILPLALAETLDARALRAVCAHELAHLKRGDHRALWIEEVSLILQAFNPLLRLIRDHRAAAREEACDAVALSLVGEDARPLYARALVDALRAPAIDRGTPVLTFTSRRRSFAMRRLKAILSPVPTSGLRPRLAVVGLGVALATVAGSGAFALTAQRAPTPLPMVMATAPAAAVAALPAERMPAVGMPAVAAVAPVDEVAPVEAPERVAAPEVSDGAVAPAPVPAPVAAQTAVPAPAAVITNPAWAERPTPNWPAEALEAGVNNGVVALSCGVESGGTLTDCQIVSETPTGAGFGAEALRAAARARLSPRTVEGATTGGRVNFNVRMQMAE
ncbi:M56 family metallopeptidase [Brevundimonas sp. R86498]|uniref:M56 family metallopeptidase n=1 Tax=Brevundimonas sp. R86498 TaxID=3093845 RepID=UPI0037C5599D